MITVASQDSGSPFFKPTANVAQPSQAPGAQAPVFNKQFHGTADFMMVGGASIIAAFVLQALDSTGLQSSPAIAGHMSNLAPMFATIALFVNYPHAVWSYRLAYQQGSGFVMENKGALIILPVALIGLLGFAAAMWSMPMSQMGPILAVDSFLANFGIFMNANMYPTFGQFLFAYLLVFQMIVLGRHYVYQSYGVALACAGGEGYRMTLDQRNFIRYNLIALWMVNMFSGYTVFASLNSMSFTYFSPRLPDFVRYASYLGFIITFYLMMTKVFIPIKKETGKWPPLNFCAALSSVYFWLQPFWYPFAYQLWIVPLAHSAQYLHFVYKVERNNFAGLASSKPVDQQTGHSPVFFAALIGLVLILGFVGFEGLPNYLDELKVAGPLVTANFWAIALNIFINVHHYFIDGVVWRSRTSRVRSLLFKAA